jgi:propionate CoA-transferase
LGTFIANLIRDIDIIILTQIDLFNGVKVMTEQPTSDNGAVNRRNKIVSAAEAVSVIKNGSMIATGGFVGTGFAEHLAVALEKRFLETGEPSNLGFVYAAGQGDGKSRGLNHFIHPGMVGKVVGGHWGLVPGLQKQAMENKISAYNLPQGIISTMFRDIAAKKPRTISSVGLGTYVDPRNGGGKINEVTTEELVELSRVPASRVARRKSAGMSRSSMRWAVPRELSHVV